MGTTPAKPPRPDGGARRADAATALAGPAAYPDGTLRVLLVEDDADDVARVRELLGASGLSVELGWARTLADALRELDAASPHCVLVDPHLPDASGLTAVERLVERAGDAAVVVLTHRVESGSGMAAVAAGAQDYLSAAQVDADHLQRAVRYAVSRKQAERMARAWQAGQLRDAENTRLERGLLPTPLLHDGTVRVTARYLPGRAHTLLGGDFYDVVQTGDGAVHAVIGDVSGHGPDEAALGVCLRVAWRAFVLAGVRGAALVQLLEQILVAERSAPEIYATLTHVTRARGADHADVVRAGHPSLLVHAPEDDVRVCEPAPGPAVGLIPGRATWSPVPVPAHDGSALVLFTDGLIEGRTGPDSRRLGEAGLLEIARRHRDLAPEPLLDALIATAQSLAAPHGGLMDDIAVLHLAWNDPRSPA